MMSLSLENVEIVMSCLYNCSGMTIQLDFTNLQKNCAKSLIYIQASQNFVI
jgi:hypothetical protein